GRWSRCWHIAQARTHSAASYGIAPSKKGRAPTGTRAHSTLFTLPGGMMASNRCRFARWSMRPARVVWDVTRRHLSAGRRSPRMILLQRLRRIVLMRQCDTRIGMATQELSETSKLAERGERTGSIGMLLLVALALTGAAVVFLLFGRNSAQPYILAFLSALAVIGVFSLFAGAAGILRLPGRDAGNAFASA